MKHSFKLVRHWDGFTYLVFANEDEAEDNAELMLSLGCHSVCFDGYLNAYCLDYEG